jgi:hypothetical protein
MQPIANKSALADPIVTLFQSVILNISIFQKHLVIGAIRNKKVIETLAKV